MTTTGPSRHGGVAAPLTGLAILGLFGLFGRKGTTDAATASVAAEGTAKSGTQRHSGRSMPAHHEEDAARQRGDSAPGESKKGANDVISGVRAYLIGLGLAAVLTAGSFWLSTTHLVYGPGIYVALIVFAIAQIGIHLVFFLHLTTSPDNINNAMALAFGTLILVVLIGGTMWIMAHMNANMMPMTGHAMPPGAMMNMTP